MNVSKFQVVLNHENPAIVATGLDVFKDTILCDAGAEESFGYYGRHGLGGLDNDLNYKVGGAGGAKTTTGLLGSYIQSSSLASELFILWGLPSRESDKQLSVALTGCMAAMFHCAAGVHAHKEFCTRVTSKVLADLPKALQGQLQSGHTELVHATLGLVLAMCRSSRQNCLDVQSRLGFVGPVFGSLAQKGKAVSFVLGGSKEGEDDEDDTNTKNTEGGNPKLKTDARYLLVLVTLEMMGAADEQTWTSLLHAKSHVRKVNDSLYKDSVAGIELYLCGLLRLSTKMSLQTLCSLVDMTLLQRLLFMYSHDSERVQELAHSFLSHFYDKLNEALRPGTKRAAGGMGPLFGCVHGLFRHANPQGDLRQRELCESVLRTQPTLLPRCVGAMHVAWLEAKQSPLAVVLALACLTSLTQSAHLDATMKGAARAAALSVDSKQGDGFQAYIHKFVGAHFPPGLTKRELTKLMGDSSNRLLQRQALCLLEAVLQRVSSMLAEVRRNSRLDALVYGALVQWIPDVNSLTKLRIDASKLVASGGEGAKVGAHLLELTLRVLDKYVGLAPSNVLRGGVDLMRLLDELVPWGLQESASDVMERVAVGGAQECRLALVVLRVLRTGTTAQRCRWLGTREETSKIVTNVVVAQRWQDSVKRSSLARLLLLCHCTDAAKDVGAAARALVRSILTQSGLFAGHDVYDLELSAELGRWVAATNVQDDSILLVDTVLRVAAAWNTPLCRAMADASANTDARLHAGSTDLPVTYAVMPASPVLVAGLRLAMCDLSLFLCDLPKQIQTNVSAGGQSAQDFFKKFRSGFAADAAAVVQDVAVQLVAHARNKQGFAALLKLTAPEWPAAAALSSLVAVEGKGKNSGAATVTAMSSSELVTPSERQWASVFRLWEGDRRGGRGNSSRRSARAMDVEGDGDGDGEDAVAASGAPRISARIAVALGAHLAVVVEALGADGEGVEPALLAALHASGVWWVLLVAYLQGPAGSKPAASVLLWAADRVKDWFATLKSLPLLDKVSVFSKTLLLLRHVAADMTVTDAQTCLADALSELAVVLVQETGASAHVLDVLVTLDVPNAIFFQGKASAKQTFLAVRCRPVVLAACSMTARKEGKRVGSGARHELWTAVAAGLQSTTSEDAFTFALGWMLQLFCADKALQAKFMASALEGEDGWALLDTSHSGSKESADMTRLTHSVLRGTSQTVITQGSAPVIARVLQDYLSRGPHEHWQDDNLLWCLAATFSFCEAPTVAVDVSALRDPWKYLLPAADAMRKGISDMHVSRLLGWHSSASAGAAHSPCPLPLALALQGCASTPAYLRVLQNMHLNDDDDEDSRATLRAAMLSATPLAVRATATALVQTTVELPRGIALAATVPVAEEKESARVVGVMPEFLRLLAEDDTHDCVSSAWLECLAATVCALVDAVGELIDSAHAEDRAAVVQLMATLTEVSSLSLDAARVEECIQSDAATAKATEKMAKRVNKLLKLVLKSAFGRPGTMNALAELLDTLVSGCVVGALVAPVGSLLRPAQVVRLALSHSQFATVLADATAGRAAGLVRLLLRLVSAAAELGDGDADRLQREEGLELARALMKGYTGTLGDEDRAILRTCFLLQEYCDVPPAFLLQASASTTGRETTYECAFMKHLSSTAVGNSLMSFPFARPAHPPPFSNERCQSGKGAGAEMRELLQGWSGPQPDGEHGMARHVNSDARSLPFTGDADNATALAQNKVLDPSFWLPALGFHLSHSKPSIRQFARCGALSVVIAALACDCRLVRTHALACLNMVSELLKRQGRQADAAFRERPQLVLLVDFAKNCFSPVFNAEIAAGEAQCPSLPCTTAVFLARAATILLNPANELYAKMSKYLLSRPFCDEKDVPLYDLLLVEGDAQENVSERLFALRMMRDGLSSHADHLNLCRKNVYSRLAVLFPSGSGDLRVGQASLDVFDRALGIRPGARYLLQRSLLYQWLSHIVVRTGSVEHSDQAHLLCRQPRLLGRLMGLLRKCVAADLLLALEGGTSSCLDDIMASVRLVVDAVVSAGGSLGGVPLHSDHWRALVQCLWECSLAARALDKICVWGTSTLMELSVLVTQSASFSTRLEMRMVAASFLLCCAVAAPDDAAPAPAPDAARTAVARLSELALGLVGALPPAPPNMAQAVDEQETVHVSFNRDVRLLGGDRESSGRAGASGGGDVGSSVSIAVLEELNGTSEAGARGNGGVDAWTGAEPSGADAFDHVWLRFPAIVEGCSDVLPTQDSQCTVLSLASTASLLIAASVLPANDEDKDEALHDCLSLSTLRACLLQHFALSSRHHMDTARGSGLLALVGQGFVPAAPNDRAPVQDHIQAFLRLSLVAFAAFSTHAHSLVLKCPRKANKADAKTHKMWSQALGHLCASLSQYTIGRLGGSSRDVVCESSWATGAADVSSMDTDDFTEAVRRADFCQLALDCLSVVMSISDGNDGEGAWEGEAVQILSAAVAELRERHPDLTAPAATAVSSAKAKAAAAPRAAAAAAAARSTTPPSMDAMVWTQSGTAGRKRKAPNQQAKDPLRSCMRKEEAIKLNA